MAGTVSAATGEFAGVCCDVPFIFVCGDGVAVGGTSNRPRRCDALGEADAVVAGAEGAATVSTGVVIATVGAGVVDVDEVCVAALVASAFTNFLGGALGGGAASDFIFWRAFFASS